MTQTPGPPAHRDDKKTQQEALFRYRVIGPLLEKNEDHTLRLRVLERAKQLHERPDGSEVRIAARTLWRWLHNFRKHGFPGLHRRLRKDKGRLEAMKPEVLERAEALRRAVPGRWTTSLIDTLKAEGLLDGQQVPHRSTVDRHLRARGASRRQLNVLGKRPTGKLQFDAFGDLWVGDYHHGPRVRAPDGSLVVAKLGAFIDHKTRYPVEDRWYLDERLSSLRDTLLRAFLTWTPPRVIYVDRGSVYRSDALAYSLQHIDTQLVHSKPYYSEGRGVIERWWQLADQFQLEVEQLPEPVDIHELNRLWEAFRTRRYLEKEHSAIGMTPLQAVADVVRSPIDPLVARDLFLLREERVVHVKDSCVSVEGTRFLCDHTLRGRKVTVRYDPNDLSEVLIVVDGQRVGRARPQPVGRHPDLVPAVAANDTKTDYLALIRADFDRRLLEQVTPVAYSSLETLDPGFDESRFMTLFADLAAVSLRGSQAVEVQRFWGSFGPLPEAFVRVALEQAVSLRGTGRHVRVYLDVLRTLALQRKKSPAAHKENDR
jgi:putative transposase